MLQKWSHGVCILALFFVIGCTDCGAIEIQDKCLCLITTLAVERL